MEPAGETDLKNSVLASRFESNLNKNRSRGLQVAAWLQSVLQTYSSNSMSSIGRLLVRRWFAVMMASHCK